MDKKINIPVNTHDKCSNMLNMYIDKCINAPRYRDKCKTNCIYTNAGKINVNIVNKCLIESFIHFKNCIKD